MRFPVNFPVSREFAQETGLNATGSSGWLDSNFKTVFESVGPLHTASRKRDDEEPEKIGGI
jgi:hypothetical protein